MVTDRDIIKFPRRKASAEKMEADRKALLDAVRMIYEKGREAAVKVYGQNYFVIAETPIFMRELGIRGQEFSISYGVVSRHYDKDGDHNLPIEVWERLPMALQTPFAIMARYRMKTNKETGKEKKIFSGYRLYTKIKLNAGFVTVGVEVKSMGMNLEVNSIQTVFIRRRKGDLEKEIYRDPDITQEQSAILDRGGHKNNTQVIVTSKRA